MATESLNVTLRTLTPIWTGGVETGKMDRLHESGVIGSLRWWYEAIVRGLGGRACDPSGHSCIYDPEKPNKGLCDVCQLFGATGWRRRFRLVIVDDQTQPAWTPDTQTLNIRPPDRNRGWFLPPGRVGSFTLRLDGDAKTRNRLAALLLFMERWGSLGAKPQLGYGVFEIEQRQEIVERAADWQSMGTQAADDNLPDLRHFGFFRYRFQPDKPGWWTQTPGIERVARQTAPLISQHRTAPVAPALKNEWRYHRWQPAWGKAHDFFGTLQPERIRSKAAVSWAYPKAGDWEVRGHVWLSNVKAKPAWAMFCDADLWQKVLSGSGVLDVHPAAAWQVWTTAEVQQFLEATR